MLNQESVQENETQKILWYFKIQTDDIGLCRSDWQQGTIKGKRKRAKHQDLAIEVRKLSSMKVTVIPIVIGALDTVTKGLVQWLDDLEIRGREETIHTTALLKSDRILRRVLETWGDLLSQTSVEDYQLTLVWKTLSNEYNNNKKKKKKERKKNETINEIISKCNKLVHKEFKTRHDSVGKMIHWELCKKLKFDHTTKWQLLHSLIQGLE